MPVPQGRKAARRAGAGWGGLFFLIRKEREILLNFG
jgi:hypothetical protein